jgi:hypothetical protein
MGVVHYGNWYTGTVQGIDPTELTRHESVDKFNVHELMRVVHYGNWCTVQGIDPMELTGHNLWTNLMGMN